MANVALSEAEKTFILHGVEVVFLNFLLTPIYFYALLQQEDFRCDGRSRRDYRPMELETEVVNNASGSARLRLANTDILVGVKCEIDKPSGLFPNQGKIEFFVDWQVVFKIKPYWH